MSTLDSLYLAEALATALGWPAWATLDEVVEAATALGWCPAEGALEERARQALRAATAVAATKTTAGDSLAEQLSQALGVTSSSLEELVIAAEALGLCGSSGTLEERAHEALAAIAQREAAGATDTPGGVVAARRGWQAIADAAWIAAGEALVRRDYRAMREHAARAKEAEERADPLLGAIFGTAAPDPAAVAAAKRRVASMPADAADTCRRAVLAEMEAHAKRMRQERMRSRSEAAARRAAREEAEREAARRERERREAEARAMTDALRQRVGQIVQCRMDTYGTIKACVPGVGEVNAYIGDARAFGQFPARIVSVGTYADGQPFVNVRPE